MIAPATSASRGWALALTFVCLAALCPALFFRCAQLTRAYGLARRACAVALALLVALAGASLAFYAVAVLADGALYPAAQTMERSCLVLGVLGAGVNLATRLPALRKRPDATPRLLVLGGTAVALALFVGLMVLPRMLGLAPAPPQLAIAGLALPPVAYVYAVQRHRLLGLPSAWDRALARAVGASALTVLYGLALVSLVPRPGAPTDPAASLARTAAAFALGVSVVPIAQATARTIDRAIFHDAYSRHAAIRSLVEEIGTATDAHAAARRALEDVRAWLDLRWLALLVPGADGWDVRALAGPEPGERRGEVRALARFGAGPERDDAGRPLVAASFPVALGTGPDALVLAGPKENGEPLRRGDRDVLAALASILGAPLTRSQLLAALQERVRELERHKGLLRRLGRRLWRAQEDERARLARQLHAEPLQLLHTLLRALEAGRPEDACLALATQVEEEVRAVCLALRPSPIEEVGLPAAIEALARRMEQRTGCPIAVVADPGTARRLHPEAALALYQIAQEALANCARHARARAITVLLREDEGAVSLDVCDDGTGFDVDAATRAAMEAPGAGGRERLGLAEMREQASAWGGTLLVVSEPGQGTQVRAVFPARAGEGGKPWA